jgi:MFS transporter, NNP family, nitrate/nitrite transporter
MTASQTALLVAVPVLLGSLARLPMRMLTDGFGGRGVFSILMGLAAIVPWLVPLASSRTSSAAMCGISLMATESGR